MNRQYFDEQQIKTGELNEFLNLLIKQSYGKGSYYNDIHIIPCDLNSVTVEWESNPWDKEYGGHWQFIHDDEEEVVMKYYYFPDNHSELFETKEQYEEALKEWLEEHKDEEWEINQYGHWYSKAEQRKWEEQIAKERENQNE